ncbi:unnamed protein product [Adineta steineri]|uniref:DUF8206 domain-containing protein n=1 Tax=Adineta steineri TaxID=433720 RepID=A0A819G2L7_9BILA|nr:unnamed protein product [Adineta steineri]
MAMRYQRQQKNSIKANRYCPPDREISILLLGQTGVGKSTFINAFANYIVNDTLEEAVNDEIQVIIPSSFSYTDQDTFEEKQIAIGFEDEYETFSTEGQSSTQQCRSFVFPIGNRNLRLIDTPGIGDTRGIEQDSKNFQEILAYIAQYEHLNAVFIMVRPNEERLNILFRFSINELLRHLNIDIKDNIMFVFTNARSSFYMPGSTKKLLEALFNKHRLEYNVEIPFSRDNTFLFDSESFRYLALCKNNIQLDENQTKSYTRSWDHSVKEYARLMKRINAHSLHAVSNILSLNEAEQLIRKLPRPIAETAKLIEENIQLAKEHKQKVLVNPQIALEGIPQNNAIIKTLKHPRTVCVGENCCRVIEVNDEKQMEYLHICHDECYLAGVVQETLYDLKLQDCTAMEPEEGFCTVCDCHWLQHKHITYEYVTDRIHIRSNKDMTLADIDRRITELRNEESKIQDIYRKLVRFLHVNAILPVNDDFIEYLQYFIREEQMKQSAGAQNTEIIDSLERLKNDYNKEMGLYKKTLEEQKKSIHPSQLVKPDEIFMLVETLYELPITGKQIKQQVDGIRIGQTRSGAQRETFVELPAKAASSKVMLELKEIISTQS